ncbi:MAG: N-acetylmuramoyl-L-alanine amidase [Odoribacter sp.]|nr:N-acetylmuramoyl-L-alanine amidase [Odoribacter sp.]
MKYFYCKAFILLVIGVIFSENAFSSGPVTKSEKLMVVVIDPGHGGKDPGAMNKGIREKDVVLGIGLKLGKLLNDNYSDIKVVFTRSTDVFVPLIERSRIANKNKADLFISLHANHCGTPSIRGTETFVLGLHRSADNLEVAKKENSVILLEDDYTENYEGFDPNLSESYIMFELVQDIYMDQSLSFADAIQNQFQSRLTTENRGVKQAGFLVLRQSSMPSVLIEAGFLSNQAEANSLRSEEGQRNIAASILDAFRKFRSKNSGTPVPTIAEKQPVVTSQTSSPNTKQETEIITKVAGKTPEVMPDIIPDAPSEKKVLENAEINENTYYSVQIGANTSPVEPVAANFKGLKEIRREKTDKYYRYYIGKETTMARITPILQQIKLKFPQAFIVSFVDGKRIIINNSSIP